MGAPTESSSVPETSFSDVKQGTTTLTTFEYILTAFKSLPAFKCAHADWCSYLKAILSVIEIDSRRGRQKFMFTFPLLDFLLRVRKLIISLLSAFFAIFSIMSFRRCRFANSIRIHYIGNHNSKKIKN